MTSTSGLFVFKIWNIANYSYFYIVQTMGKGFFMKKHLKQLQFNYCIFGDSLHALIEKRKKQLQLHYYFIIILSVYRNAYSL